MIYHSASVNVKNASISKRLSSRGPRKSLGCFG
jgi:hypothetical protein